MVRPVSPSRCASAASASGKVPAIVARNRPVSTSSAIVRIPARSASTSIRTARTPSRSASSSSSRDPVGRIDTTTRAASGVDICLHLIRKDHGSELANKVARRCVVPPFRDGGQAKYIEQPVPEAGPASTAATRAWALEHLGEPLTLADLATHARMSLRTFARRFQDEVGVSPGRWLIQQRVVHARHLPEASDLPVDQIAGRVGFATGASLRQHLHAAIGVSPQAYRRTFQTAR